jgi:hypothetical protein
LQGSQLPASVPLSPLSRVVLPSAWLPQAVCAVQLSASSTAYDPESQAHEPAWIALAPVSRLVIPSACMPQVVCAAQSSVSY